MKLETIEQKVFRSVITNIGQAFLYDCEQVDKVADGIEIPL